MSHFARVGADNIVKEVIVAEYDFLDANPQLLAEGERWIRTSYNTFGGVHQLGDNVPLRMNYAGIGYTFDQSVGEWGAFIPPQPGPEYVLNPDTCQWELPTT